MEKQLLTSKLTVIESKINTAIIELKRIKRDPKDSDNAERMARKAINTLNDATAQIHQIKMQLL